MADKRKVNQSGCYDPTAFEAIENITKEEKEELRLEAFLGHMFYMADLAGFHIEERIVLKDNRTGKIRR